MLSLIATILIPIIKWIFERKAKKKLSDKEFVAYISAHQKMRGRAGHAATEWEKALKEAQEEMDKDK